MKNSVIEANFDGLAGPTHNYSGLAPGNIAATKHAKNTSNPREAALQGLAKMKLLYDFGTVQGVLPPQERPNIEFLRRAGLSGSEAQILEKAQGQPDMLATASSASSLWAANAATVSPSPDTADGKVHFTPANLVTNKHRALEAETTGDILKTIFNDAQYFVHHSPLAGDEALRDEGAANHTRFCTSYGDKGIHLFVYGQRVSGAHAPLPQRFPARQTYEASLAIAERHGLRKESTYFAQQNPAAIDLGVFHNDVISVGNQNVFLFHEKVFLETSKVVQELEKMTGDRLLPIEVKEKDFSVADAVTSYFFNSQLISTTDGKMLLISPLEAKENVKVQAFIANLLKQNTPIKEVHFCDLRQSMRNGGGPACLRLRVVLAPDELAAVNRGCLLTNTLLETLQKWVVKHYRERLLPEDLADPNLLHESRTALDELTRILKLGSLYAFQK